MINIPTDAAVARDSRLTTVQIIKALHKREVEGSGGFKGQIVSDLVKKKRQFAESDHVVARLRPAGTATSIIPAKFFKLLRDGDITEKDFLSALTVKASAAEEFLSPEQIKTVSTKPEDTNPVLYTEFRPGITIAPATDLPLVLKMLVRDVAV